MGDMAEATIRQRVEAWTKAIAAKDIDVSGTLASGHSSDLWLRWTACFRRIGGVWLVVHDHASVPADLAHGQALVGLEP